MKTENVKTQKHENHKIQKQEDLETRTSEQTENWKQNIWKPKQSENQECYNFATPSF